MQAEDRRQIEKQIAASIANAVGVPIASGPGASFSPMAQLPRLPPLPAEKTMPEGYELREGACGGHWVRRSDGTFLRDRDLAPQWFSTPVLAIDAAIEDCEAKQREL